MVPIVSVRASNAAKFHRAALNNHISQHRCLVLPVITTRPGSRRRAADQLKKHRIKIHRLR